MPCPAREGTEIQTQVPVCLHYTAAQILLSGTLITLDRTSLGPAGLRAKDQCWEGQSFSTAKETPDHSPNLQPRPTHPGLSFPKRQLMGGKPLCPEALQIRPIKHILNVPQPQLQPCSGWREKPFQMGNKYCLQRKEMDPFVTKMPCVPRRRKGMGGGMQRKVWCY